MDKGIRSDFVEGIYEIFTTLFTDGKNDGLNLYFLNGDDNHDIYGEQKYKKYKNPILLVCSANLTPTMGGESIEVIKEKAIFKIPLKSFEIHNLGVTHKDLDILRKCVIEYHGIFYSVENVKPKVFVEDTFHIFEFECKEDNQLKNIMVLEESEEDVGFNILEDIEDIYSE